MIHNLKKINANSRSTLQLFCRPIAVYILALIAIGNHSCKKKSFSSRHGPVLVEIDNNRLYASEIEKMIHDDTSSEDSTAIANAFIDRWVKEKLLLLEAQKFITSDFEIEEKVEQYRNELIRFKHEVQILDSKMSSDITAEELGTCYDKYKRNYILKRPIYKVMYASIPDNAKKIDRFYNAWLNSELDFIKSYSDNNADTLVLEHENWIDETKMRNIVPRSLIKGRRLRSDMTVQKHIKNSEHFFKITEMKTKGDTIPLELISDKISRLLLHERKKETIEKYKEDIYEKALRSNRIKINI